MKCLLLIDLQKDFCKNGALEIKNADDIIEIANFLIKKFKNNLIVATKDWHPSTHKSFAINSDKNIGETITLKGIQQILWPVHCVQNSLGSEFHNKLLRIENIIYKGTDENIDSYSAFFDNKRLKKTELENFLNKKNIDTLYIMGLATDYCVKYTVFDALSLGYKVFVVVDGCRGVDLEKNTSTLALKEMEDMGATLIYSEKIVL